MIALRSPAASPKRTSTSMAGEAARISAARLDISSEMRTRNLLMVLSTYLGVGSERARDRQEAGLESRKTHHKLVAQAAGAEDLRRVVAGGPQGDLQLARQIAGAFGQLAGQEEVAAGRSGRRQQIRRRPGVEADLPHGLGSEGEDEP